MVHFIAHLSPLVDDVVRALGIFRDSEAVYGARAWIQQCRTDADLPDFVTKPGDIFYYREE